MDNTFFYTFPAIKGKQASRDFFVIMCPLSVLSKLFVFNDNDLPPEYRAQRIINKSRIPEIASYIVDNPNDYVFSSITASIDGQFQFLSFDENFNDKIGTLKVSMDSRLLINDGQHRRAAIENALKNSPSLGSETISVVLFIDEGLKKSQQIFADLNKHAVNVSNSIAILYDSRDPIAMFTKLLLKENDYLKHYTDKENSSLSKFSPKLFTLNSINRTNKNLLNKLNISDIKICNFAKDFWSTLCVNMKEWQFVFNKHTSPHLFRTNYINSHGVVLEALGLVGNYLYVNHPSNWRDILKNVNNINWHRSNLEDWQYRAIGPNGRIVKSAAYVKLTSNLIKIKLNLPLNKEELKLEKDCKKDG
ncbi:DNA sulfur modification protein DndB [Clostridium botulinum]|uniref:DNA sulfur modification protein DndB n=1 Tax=Clostridium botulinum TaxID=1491 RepID=A0A9Q1ZCL6_CLOBO|nr:DNA sulfur modification protein DndB [Clostridium botulinum]AEB76746.1 DNA sulfur modification protein DndB [Clostridium botulinum BKT015925]KEI03136.1 DNA sulfur modification protein DndB [Clostridium botulinum C/D str. Sp77]KLU76339.1 DNA sulfur modification protein DndB [Clostridium botulinum V891]KOA79185.1 DNA sulfur modification protein DndB [Clostridium botulinum]KOA83819.1 DNA sulfur modification protein DndB [Clostridium botulinum]